MGERFAILCATRTTPAAARVAHALTRHGAEVCMVAPPDSFAALTRFKAADILLPPEEMAQRMPSIVSVLAEEFRAHSVLVSDDFCFSVLTDLLRRPDEARLGAAGAAMLARSMPPLNIARVLESDADFIVSQLGKPCGPPPSLANPSQPDALRFAAETGYPVMVKRNAFAGGLGVARCDDARALRAALAENSANPRDPRFVVQKFIAGEVHAVAVSGVCGKAAAALSFIKKVNTGPHGQACILQYARRDDLIAHARGVFEALKLNGYAGLDYIVDENGRAYLLEINQCLVMKSHFSDCFGVDLTAAMLAMHRGQPLPASRPPTHEYVALFPSEWARDPASPQLYHAYHDVPWEDPALLSGMIAYFHAHRVAGARKRAHPAQTLAD